MSATHWHNGNSWSGPCSMCPLCRVADLESELQRYREGYQGSCYCCETVGEKNVQLEAENERLRGLLSQALPHVQYAHDDTLSTLIIAVQDGE